MSNEMGKVKTLRQLAGLQTPTTIVPAKSALLLIDFQMEYYGGGLPIPDGEAAVNNAAQLIAWADRGGTLVVHIHHIAGHPQSPLFTPGGPRIAPHALVVPGQHHLCVTKGLPSSFVATGLQALLKEKGIETLIVTGLMTHMCVDSTTRDALSLDFKCIVVSDACATRDLPDYAGRGVVPHGELHRAVLTGLSDRFADVMSTAAVLELT